MNMKIILAIVVLIIVIVLGAILIATPAPEQEEVLPPFVSINVRVTTPLPQEVVDAHAFTVTGHARGPWFFEASFPVEVRDPQNNVIGRGIAQADGEWMTTEFVPFTAPITMTPGTYVGPAVLVLIKDNPSGLPEHDDSVSFPIVIQ